MATIERDWMESAHSTQDSSSGPDLPPDIFSRKESLVTRAFSFLGEVITGKPKARAAEPAAPGRTTSARPRVTGQKPLPAQPDARREAERAVEISDRAIYIALKGVLDREPGMRLTYKPLWSVEQNIKSLGIRGMDDMSLRVTRLAMEQLDMLADCSAGPLWQLRDFLVAKNTEGNLAEADMAKSTAAAEQPPEMPPETIAQAQSNHPDFYPDAAPVGLFEIGLSDEQLKFIAPQVSSPPTTPTPSAPVAGARGMQMQMPPTDYKPAPMPEFEVDLDMELPALRQREGRGG